jgi:serine-type D-Ala-D-Ala carboxypeptidase (penicillin-binding protein 5/6)
MLLRDGSQVMGLHPDERVSIRTLLHGLMLWSGNDAAEQLALYLGAGSRERYLEWMNLLVERIGLKDTHFVTPSGMDAPGHYSSAYDMAILARYAMQNDTFRTLVGTPFYEGDQYPIPNINTFLTVYPGADGVKTGFTDDAGRTIVASATRDGQRVFVSLMNSANLVADATALMDWAFAAHEWPR